MVATAQDLRVDVYIHIKLAHHGVFFKAGAPAQRGEHHSIRLWMKALKVVRSSGVPKKCFAQHRKPSPATGFGGLLGDVTFAGKIVADSETQKIE